LERLKTGIGSPSPLGVPDLVRAGSSLGDAIAGHRALGREDRTLLGTVAVLVLVIAGFSAFFPFIVGWFIAFVAGWFGIVLGVRAVLQARRARLREEAEDAERDQDEETPEVQGTRKREDGE
jgi:uncharacterized membrane protein